MNPEDIIAKVAVTYPINISTATTTTVRTTPAGNRFHVLGLYLRAGGAQTVVFQSDANVLSGVITLADNEEINMPMGTVPHMSGQATGESFKITTTAAEDIDGWAIIAEEK
jgi:hypothetical protein